MLKCLGRLFLHYLQLALDPRPDTARGCKDSVKTNPLTEGRGEEILASEFSFAAPCVNGCIAASPMGARGKGSTATAGYDP